jgi:hypothetical protein
MVTGVFTLGGLAVSHMAATLRDEAKERQEAKKRRDDKFEEL